MPDFRPTSAPSTPPTRPSFLRRCGRSCQARFGVLIRGHRMWQVVVDALLISSAYWLAFFLRFDTGTPLIYERAMFQTIGIVTTIKILIFVITGVYIKWWRYLTVKDMEGIFRSVLLASVAALTYLYLAQPSGVIAIPRSVAVLDFAFTLFLIAGIRFVARSIYERPSIRNGMRRTITGSPVLIIGAGEAGRTIIREMQRQPMGFLPVGLIDDDERKQHMRLDGVQVLGTTAQIPGLVRNLRVEEVIIAVPSANGATIRRIVEICRTVNVNCRILPSLNELVRSDRNLTTQLRTVQVEDVLGREPVTLDLQQIADYLTDQVVLVTGAGGSIGSELCRQISRVNPQLLVMVDHAENNLFTIEQELTTERGFTDLVPVMADATNRGRMQAIVAQHQPTVIFHAAAYKHVPMMELNPLEAIRNNSLGTQVMCEVAEEAGVSRFVLVSTDKAVEPQTVMGQSKALAEWIVQGAAARSTTTRFMAVRFGNVLGSSGSVVPIFRRQIERGGPVRVTDERMTRFFMTIPEAVQLIIQAGSMGAGGEVFVLDMGEPVKIIDLARNMIELSGRTPGVDVDIEIVGIRPGEKLHEDLFAGDETVVQTSHDKIWRSNPERLVEHEQLAESLSRLAEHVETGDAAAAHLDLNAILKPRIDAGVAQVPIS